MNIFTNIKALEYSNVETVIVFQTLTTFVVAYGDYKYLNSGNFIFSFIRLPED